MNILNFKLVTKSNEPVCIGDIFSIPVTDIDENVNWTLKYCMKSEEEFIYLGGGIDFNLAIGKIITRDQLNKEIEYIDPLDEGIVILIKAKHI